MVSLPEEVTFLQRLEGAEGGSLMNIWGRLFRAEGGSLWGVFEEQPGGQSGCSRAYGVRSELRSEGTKEPALQEP